MKVTIKILVLSCFTALSLSAQKMSWIPSKYIADNACEDLSNCSDNMVCYKLQYIPGETGQLTSYTTGFIVNCDDNVSAIKSNSSCLLDDQSEQILACEEEGKILLHCSAKNGNIQVSKNQPVYLHQICFQFEGNRTNSVIINESEFFKLTSSLDMPDGGAITERSSYQRYVVTNSHQTCLGDVENLKLEGTMDEKGLATLQWEPAREVEGGTYILYHSYDGNSFNEIAVFDSKMLHQTSDKTKYTQDFLMEEYGEHFFQVSYVIPGERSLTSNMTILDYINGEFSFTFAPNPASHLVKLFVTSEEQEINYTIRGINGQLVKSKLIRTQSEQLIDVSDMAAGIYSISIESQGETISKKLIVID